VLPPLFGPVGLYRVVKAALATASAGSVTLTIEVHAPVPAERRPLGEHERLFAHWRDRTNAERMNYWLDQLLLNATLLREACTLPL